MTSNPPLLITHRLVVRFSDCDPLGHVNNARYLTYLEQTRIELWRRQAGLELRRAAVGASVPSGSSSATSASDSSQGFILARTEIDFLAPAHDGDVLEVRLTLDGIGRSSVTYGYEMLDVTTGGAVARAKSVVVWYDYATSKSVPLTDANKRLLSAPVSGTSSEQYSAL
jgi:acyl-CoA thioester hydrolase